MKPPNKPGGHDAQRVIREYETLRANARGELSQSHGFMLLLRQGMSGWMRALKSSGPTIRRMLSPAPSAVVPLAEGARLSSAGVATILTDAILDMAGPAVRR
jgi:hypothetical protein